MTTYLDRLAQHLASPDALDLIGRGSHITYPGRADRRHSVLKPLLTRWMVTRHLEVDPQESSARTVTAQWWRKRA